MNVPISLIPEEWRPGGAGWGGALAATITVPSFVLLC